MKVLLLANPDSSHTLKWARALSQKMQIGLFGFNSAKQELYVNYPEIKLFGGLIDRQFCVTDSGAIKKLYYVKALPSLMNVIRTFKPDIVHSHFLSSYGILGMLSGFKPHVVSVWGSDIFDFPKYSFVHRYLTKLCLKRASKVLSTSRVMAEETRLYTDKDVEVTPFGIDLEIFKKTRVDSMFKPDEIVIGTVKTLHEKYGIEYLVRAFHKVKTKYPLKPLKLLLVGGGELANYIRDLVNKLGLAECTVLTGAVPYDEVVKYHNMLSISVSVSIFDSESFGVAIIEAGACEKPVIVSNVGGLPEVVENGVTGLVVAPRSIDETASAIEKLVLEPELREKMGMAGRERVKRLYDWGENVSQMEQIYRGILGQNKKLK